ncbi:MAG: CoA ester lyase [Pseudomonadota bacterium]
MPATRSLLFAPANRPDLYPKLDSSGADIACLDLEDAVPPSDKEDARAMALPWIAAAASGPRRALRLNPLSTRAGLSDLHAVSGAAHDDALIVLPKVDDPAEMRLAAAAFAETGKATRLVALIESLRGLQQVDDIASASDRTEFLLFGAVDLTAELGADLAHEPLLYARSRIVLAARSAGIGAMDVPCLDFRNRDAVEKEAHAARRLGFSGKAAIHPSNLETINAAFTPGEAEIARARTVIAAYEASDTGLVVIDGKLIEKPVIRSMARILEAARAAGVA